MKKNFAFLYLLALFVYFVALYSGGLHIKLTKANYIAIFLLYYAISRFFIKATLFRKLLKNESAKMSYVPLYQELAFIESSKAKAVYILSHIIALIFFIAFYLLPAEFYADMGFSVLVYQSLMTKFELLFGMFMFIPRFIYAFYLNGEVNDKYISMGSQIGYGAVKLITKTISRFCAYIPLVRSAALIFMISGVEDR